MPIGVSARLPPPSLTREASRKTGRGLSLRAAISALLEVVYGCLLIIVLVAMVGAFAARSARSTSASHRIDQHAVGGAPLGLRRAAYIRRLGHVSYTTRLPGGLERLTFARREIVVYLSRRSGNSGSHVREGLPDEGRRRPLFVGPFAQACVRWTVGREAQVAQRRCLQARSPRLRRSLSRGRRRHARGTEVPRHRRRKCVSVREPRRSRIGS